jgi:predicted dehydrogenase
VEGASHDPVSDMSVLRIGIVGVGDVAQRDYLPEFGRLRGKARLVAVS